MGFNRSSRRGMGITAPPAPRQIPACEYRGGGFRRHLPQTSFARPARQYRTHRPANQWRVPAAPDCRDASDLNEGLRHSGSHPEWGSTDRHEGAWGLRRRLRRGKFQLANIEEGDFVVIYRKHLLPDRHDSTGPIVLPISGASQPHLIVGMLPILTKVCATRVLTRNGVQQIVTKGHGDYGAACAAANSSLRISRRGISSSSTANIFCPTGTTVPDPSSCQSVARPSRT